MSAAADNLSAVLYGIDDIRMEDRPMPEPKDNEVLIRMHSVGICGSDVHYWTNGRIGDFILTTPMVLGHESSGTVAKLGPNVTHLKVGDRVAIEPGVPCRHCDFCMGGRYNLCLDVKFAATPPVHGTLTRYYTHAADFCYKLPENVSFEDGALLEPLSVGVHACRRAGVAIGKNVLILGAGPIGLVSLLTAKAIGCASTVITDIDNSRLECAKKLGANATINVSGLQTEDIIGKIKESIPDLPDCTLECSGAEPSIRLGILATKSGGALVLIGLGKPESTIPIVNAAVREVDVRGIFRYANCYPAALGMIASGLVDASPLVTHRFSLEDSVKAFETSKTGAGNCIKVMIKCDKD